MLFADRSSTRGTFEKGGAVASGWMPPVDGGEWPSVERAALLIQTAWRRYGVQRRRWWAVHRFDRRVWAEWEQFRVGTRAEGLQERVAEIRLQWRIIIAGYDWF